MAQKNKVTAKNKSGVKSSAGRAKRVHATNSAAAAAPKMQAVGEKVLRAARMLRKDRTAYHGSADLPWRKLRTPYRVFLAEFLLVRTRADVVGKLFDSIVERYPDMHSLASASEQELASVLEPLGLRKRVPLLLRGAQHIVEKYKGRVPKTVKELMRVPGLGAYSAVAIAAFAYKQSEVPADVNILRFLSRLTGYPMLHITKGSRELWSMLPLLSQDVGGPEPERLLDFSRLICRPGLPRCELCPVREECAFFASARTSGSSS